MRVELRSPQTFFAGVIYVVVGIAAIVGGARLGMYGPDGMGPGYLPAGTGILLNVVGVIEMLKGIAIDGPPIRRQPMRPVVMLILAVLAFALLAPTAGFVVAALATSFLASLGGPEFRLREALILACGLTLLCVLIFIVGLSLPFRMWPF